MARFTKEQVRACYHAYLSRPGPENLGTVEWPKAKQGCLRGMKFLTTGILETIEREDAVELLRDCGGHVMSGMSKNLSYLIVGRDAGPVKLEKAEEWGITQLGEEEFFNFIKEKIENYDPSQDDGVDEKPKKKPAAKKPAVEKKPVVKKEPAKAVKSSKKTAAVKAEVDVKPPVVEKKKRTARNRVAINMSEDNDEEMREVVTKRVKKEENGKVSKNSMSDITTPDAKPIIKLEVSDEPAPEVEKKVAEHKKPNKKKAVKVKAEPVDEEVTRKRGRPKKSI